MCDPPRPRPLKDALKSALQDARSLWFLCSGNVVRSAFAEVYARHKGCPIPVHSAAARFHNERMFPETERELKARGVGRVAIERFEPVHLDEVAKSLRVNDVVLGMTQDHLEAVLHHVDTPRELSERVFLLGDSFWNSEEIADPVLDGADFSKTFQRVALAVETLVTTLRSQRQGVRS